MTTWLEETNLLISDWKYQLESQKKKLVQLQEEIKHLELNIKNSEKLIESYKEKHKT